jgi:hypothetical protein
VFNVNSLADILNPAPGVVTLRSAIQAANATPGGNTINLTLPGTYQISLIGTPGETDNAAGEFAILPSGGDLTIQNASGGRVVVDGGGLNRVFDINPNFDPANPTAKFLVTLQGLTIQDGVASDAANADGPNASGGGIRDIGNASLTLNNMVITHNSATADGGGVVMENTVGVPWTLTVNNSVISNNHAGDAGGGIDADGMGKVFINPGTLITGNTSVNQGAGIWLDAVGQGTVASVTVTNGGTGYTSAPTVTFSPPPAGGTTATGIAVITGGVVTAVTITNPGSGYTTPPTITITGGGGTCATATANLTPVTANLTISGAVISGNSALAAGTLGGGVGNAGTGTVTILNSLIENNFSAGTGGGFGDENNLGTLIVQDSEFLNNSAFGNGGGIQATGPQTTITGTSFVDNTSEADGGGLFVSTGTVTVTNSRFAGNVATNGGGIADAAPSLTVTASLCDGNHAVGTANATGGAGGAVNVENWATSVTISNSLFRNNSAINGTQGTGGAISQAFGTLTVSKSQFTANSADSNGGAVFFAGTSGMITASTFNNNQALADGGAIDVANGSQLTVQESTLVGNTAGNAGGALVTLGSLTVLSDTINGNTSYSGSAGVGGGGGIRTRTGSALTIEDTIIVGNSSGFSGPDAYTLGGNITDNGGNLIGSTAAAVGFGAGTKFGIDPKLGPLENNGGPIVGLPGFGQVLQTEALLTGSPAIDKGVAAGVPSTDERGFARPANLSIGAFEPQFVLGTSANGLFVESIYETVLNRRADPAAAGWVAFLNQGGSAFNLIVAIESSTEYRIIEVQSLYQRYLHRQADMGGLQVFVNFLGTGGTVEQVAAILVGSPEYFQLHGGTNEGFLAALYEDALNRAADEGGQATFSQALNSGLSRLAVAGAVFGSPEFLADLVQADYQNVLGRQPDPAAQTAFLRALQTGASDQALLAALLGSPEAFGKRTT